jgi:AcrR family transcriptional regulator
MFFQGETMTQQRSEETRANILDAAVRRFAISGYDSASVDEICAEAGVSKGAFYHHFPTKQAVFLALIEGWLTTIEVGLQGLRQATVPETFVHMTRLLPAIFAAADERLPMFLEFWTQASRDETVWAATIAPYRHYRDYFADLIRTGMQEGSLKPGDPDTAAQVVFSLAVGLFLQGILDPRGADWQKVGEESMRIIMEGMANK